MNPQPKQIMSKTETVTRDWQEDFWQENGNYNCICYKCDNIFIGHKRRIVCKICDTVLPPAHDAAIEWLSNGKNDDNGCYNAFIDGANWQSQQAALGNADTSPQHSYSEQEVPKWISVKDRLPTDGQFYLTCYKSNDYYRCETGQVYTRKDGSKYFVDDNESAINATHWMPLPAPPKQ